MTSLSWVRDPMRDLWMRAKRDCGFGGRVLVFSFFPFCVCQVSIVRGVVVDCDSNNDS